MALAKIRPDLETLAAVMAQMIRRLPAGFDAVDVAILDWIAAEGRRVERSYLPL